MPKKRGGHGGGHGNAERWLLTYADMITLLVAFFVMMYSMSVLNLAKFRQVAISIRSGFGGQMDDGGSALMTQAVSGGKPTIMPEFSAIKSAQVAQQIRKYIKEKKLQDEVRLQETERGLVVSMVTDKMLFHKGQADISPEAGTIIDKVASLIANTNSLIRVEGHTDNLPISNDRYPSNWELSTARASAVIRFLIEHAHIASARLSAAGYADSRPLVPNDSEAHRAYNRRVDIVILRNGDSPSE